MLNTDSQRPLHVALWSPAWPLAHYQNGIITYVHWMRPGLKALGHRVSIITGEVVQGGEEPGVHLVRSDLRESALRMLGGKMSSPEQIILRFPRLIAAEILRVHRRDPIDVLEMEESFGWHADVAKRTGIPVVVRLHGPAFLSLVEEELNTDFGKWRVRNEGVALRQADLIVSPCRSTLLQTVEHDDITNRAVHHIVNPVDLHENTPLWRLADCDRNSILFVGRFDMRKGADVVLRAFQSALCQNPLLRLVFVGPDLGLPSTNGKVHIKEFVAELFPAEFRDRVEYLGRMSNREITKLRARSMVTVIGSRWENPGFTLLEAMLQGCPVVCTDAGGCPEHVLHQVTGRVARSGDAESFAAEILAMVSDAAEAERLGQAARQYALEQHAPDVVATASVQLYRRLISRTTTQPK